MRIALPPLISSSAIVDLDPALPVMEMGGETMGTRWRVLAAMLPHRVSTVETAMIARLDGLVGEMSHWQPGSHLCRFNRAGAGSWHPLPRDFAEVMAVALRVAEESEGLFDPAIGALVDLWGFGARPAARPPTTGEVVAALARSGRRRLGLDPAARRLYQAGGVALDLSGIAKGYAVDALADQLAALGIGHALVEVGGELAGRGVRPNGDPWWVELENPPGVALPPLRIALHGLAVATSGDYRRGAHTVDPRSGRPSRNGVVSASVIANRAVEADAWASALTVAGSETAMALAAAHRLAARLIVVDEEGCRELISPALAVMLAE